MTRADNASLVRVARRSWLPKERSTELADRCATILNTSCTDTAISVLTAGTIHGLWLPDATDPRIHVATTTPERLGRSMTRGQRPEVVAHRFRLRESDVVLIDGLRVTSVARTWRDLATVLTLPDLVAAGDSALRAGTTRDELLDVLASSSPRHNAARARQALGMLDERARSRPESHLRVAVSGGDMPQFEVNEPIYRLEGGWLAEPDLSLEGARIALEYQGETHAQRMRQDMTRFQDMRSERWLVLAYGPAETLGRPHLIRAEVRAEIMVRAPHLLRRSH